MKKQLNKKELNSASGGGIPKEIAEEIREAKRILEAYCNNPNSVSKEDYNNAISILAKHRIFY